MTVSAQSHTDHPESNCAYMNLHKPSGSATVGLVLALLSAWIWGTLPVALKILLLSVDVVTLTRFRFLGWRRQTTPVCGP